MDDALLLRPALELAAAVRQRDVSARELLDAAIARVERIDPQLNAVCTRAFESARLEAEAADRRTVRGDELPEFHGLPITVKDAIETAGIRSTGGAEELAGHVPSADAPAVAALRAAGAIVFAKTNVPAWSGDIQTFNSLFGTTRNPWDPERVPGGSSGGAAVAVACGLTAFELGTDIGGSVRVPSAFCGVFGHKPSYGLVPTLGYLDSAHGGSITEADVNVFGPIARSAADLAALLDVLAGPDPARAAAWRVELPRTPRPEGVRGLRVAAWLDDPALPVDPELVAVHAAAADALEAAGAVVDRTARPGFDLDRTWRLGSSLIGIATSVSESEASIARMRALLDDPATDPGTRFALGRLFRPHRDWLAADRARAEVRAVWARFFEDWDVLLCPVSIATAFPHQQEGGFGDRRTIVGGVERPYLELIAWASLIGSAYLPATSVPVGATAAGLPVGVQVVAPFLHDHRAIEVAGLLASLTRGYVVPPVAR